MAAVDKRLDFTATHINVAWKLVSVLTETMFTSSEFSWKVKHGRRGEQRPAVGEAQWIWVSKEAVLLMIALKDGFHTREGENSWLQHMSYSQKYNLWEEVFFPFENHKLQAFIEYIYASSVPVLFDFHASSHSLQRQTTETASVGVISSLSLKSYPGVRPLPLSLRHCHWNLFDCFWKPALTWKQLPKL